MEFGKPESQITQKRIIAALSQKIRKETLSHESGKKVRRVQTNRANYMSDEAFADLKEAMEGGTCF